MKRKFLVTILAVFTAITAFAQQQIEQYRDGDRVVWFGDSITDGGHYHSYVWLYYMTRFPYMDVRMINAGIGGDTAGDMFERMDGDMFNYRPTVLAVTFGMNDSGYMEYTKPGAEEFGNRMYAASIENFKKIEERLKGTQDLRVMMLGSAPYDETAKFENILLPGKNAVIKRIIEYQKQSAERNGWEFMDFNEPMVELSKQLQQKDSSFTLTGGDRIHPDNAGHMYMAYLVLKAQGLAGKPVAEIMVDAASRKVVRQENCAVTNLQKISSKEIVFDYTAESLPYPLDTVARGWNQKQPQSMAKEFFPLMDEINREMLQIKGLKKGDWTLYIDDVELGTWPASAFAEGINLAGLPFAPQYQQALEVMYLNEIRWEIERNFRDYAWVQYGFFQGKGLLDVNDEHAIKVYDENRPVNGWLNVHRDNYSKMLHKNVRDAKIAQMELLREKIYEINKPETRTIRVRQK